MVTAARISHRMEILDIDDLIRLEKLLKKAGLPTEIPDIDFKGMMLAMKHDKKVVQEKVRFVLLKSIGHAFITDEVEPSLVEEVLGGLE